jgi:hypothetical protein
MLVAALEAEPEPHARFPRAELDRVARAFADFADLKSPWMSGQQPKPAAGSRRGSTRVETGVSPRGSDGTIGLEWGWA